MSSEVEYKGIKIKGSKLLLLLPLLGTLGGVLWGGFEFYKDYMNMRDKINEYDVNDIRIRGAFHNRFIKLSKLIDSAFA